MRREPLQILRSVKKFDRAARSFRININYKTVATVTPRTLAVFEAFGLDADKNQSQSLYDNVELQIGQTDIAYITGESGSGKSIMLEHLEKLLQPNAANMHNISTLLSP